MDTSVIATRQPSAPVELDDAVHVFARARPGLLRIAGRILRDAGDAEDVIQEAWLRWQCTDRAAVANPFALLRTTTVRLAVNVLQSARRRHEASATPWLPDTTDTGVTPEAVAERQDAVERAVLLLLRTLTAKQCAAYVLREGFGYAYDRIGELLGMSAANARKQVSRAQERLGSRRHREPVDPAVHRRLVEAILTAARTGDLGRLEETLTAGDGPARHRPCSVT